VVLLERFVVVFFFQAWGLGIKDPSMILAFGGLVTATLQLGLKTGTSGVFGPTVWVMVLQLMTMKLGISSGPGRGLRRRIASLITTTMRGEVLDVSGRQRSFLLG